MINIYTIPNTDHVQALTEKVKGKYITLEEIRNPNFVIEGNSVVILNEEETLTTLIEKVNDYTIYNWNPCHKTNTINKSISVYYLVDCSSSIVIDGVAIEEEIIKPSITLYVAIDESFIDQYIKEFKCDFYTSEELKKFSKIQTDKILILDDPDLINSAKLRFSVQDIIRIHRLSPELTTLNGSIHLAISENKSEVIESMRLNKPEKEQDDFFKYLLNQLSNNNITEEHCQFLINCYESMEEEVQAFIKNYVLNSGLCKDITKLNMENIADLHYCMKKLNRQEISTLKTVLSTMVREEDIQYKEVIEKFKDMELCVEIGHNFKMGYLGITEKGFDLLTIYGEL